MNSHSIDPIQMTTEQAHLLWLLLRDPKYLQTSEFKKGSVYNITIKEPTVSNISIQLEKSVVKYERNHVQGEFRYAVIENEIAKGGCSTVSTICGTLMAPSTQEFSLFKYNTNRRVIKVMTRYPNNAGVGTLSTAEKLANNEYNMNKLANNNHVKKPVVLPENRCAIIFRYIDGKDLSYYLNQEEYCPCIFNINQRIDLSKKLALALQEQVHALGVVHRDIKPENIKVKLDHENNILSLTIFDWGLAKKSPTASDIQKNKPIINESVGTPLYISYENLNNFLSTDKSDVFSLGRILWFIWMGPVPTSNKEIYELHLKMPPIDRFFKHLDDADLGEIYKEKIYGLLKQINHIDRRVRPSAIEVAAFFQELELDLKPVFVKTRDEQHVNGIYAIKPRSKQ